jgi:hypothetical protein
MHQVPVESSPCSWANGALELDRSRRLRNPLWSGKHRASRPLAAEACKLLIESIPRILWLNTLGWLMLNHVSATTGSTSDHSMVDSEQAVKSAACRYVSHEHQKTLRNFFASNCSGRAIYQARRPLDSFHQVVLNAWW